MEIKEFINGEVNQNLKYDGGGCEYISEDGGVLNIKLTGACGSCPMSTYTLKQGIEVAVKEQYPNIISVESV